MIFGCQRSMFNVSLTNVDHKYELYRTPRDFIARTVDQMVLNVLKIIGNMGALTYNEHYGTTTRSFGYFQNRWPTCDSLNIHTGFESVIQEMKTWNALPPLKEWMFHVNFVSLKCNRHTEFYTYEVLWSIPTPPYPEPQVTVSVIFYIAANHNFPPKFPVDVTYAFEGHHFIHTPNVIFRPKWLYDILDMKTMMFQSFNF